MSVIADPTNEDSNFHVRLENKDGEVFGLIVCNSNGEPDPSNLQRRPYRGTSIISKSPAGRFDDREPPYVAVVQSDFSLGRGQEDLERNAAKFYDSGFLWTIDEGKMYPAPLFHLTEGYRYMDAEWPGSVHFAELIGSQQYLDQFFTASATYEVNPLYVILKYVGTPGTFTLELCDDDGAGKPDTVLQTVTLTTADLDPDLSIVYPFDLSDESLTATNDYHIKVYGASGDDVDNCWKVAIKSTGSSLLESDDDSTWTAKTGTLYYIATDSATRGKRYGFVYQHCLFQVFQDDAGGTVYLHQNGVFDKAHADSTVAKLVSAAPIAFPSDLSGVVYIYDGTGAGQVRAIGSVTTENSANDTIVPAEDFDIAPDDTSVFCTLGEGQDTQWSEITGHGLTNITGRPLVVGDIIYFPQGDSVALRRGTFVPGTGWSWAADSTNKAVKMALGMTAEGEYHIYALNNSDANGDVSVSHSVIKDWGTDLVLTEGSSPIPVGDNDSRARDLIYLNKLMFIIKDDGLYAILGSSDGTTDAVDIVLDELRYFRSIYTGSAVLFKTPYLYYNVGPFFEQFYDQLQTDLSINSGKGLPLNRQGFPSSAVSNGRHPVVAVNAGSTGYSSAVVYAGNGWHEIYRAPYGERIHDVYVQSIPGLPSRLWIIMDRIVGYMLLGENVDEPEYDSRVDFHWESYFTTSWISDDTLDISKFWAYIRLFTENLSEDNQIRIFVDYQTDDETDSDEWHHFTSPYDSSPSQEFEVGHGLVTGKRIRFRFRLETEDSTTPPKIKAWVVDYVARYPVSETFIARILISQEENEPMEDINGDEADFTGEELYNFLKRCEKDPAPLRFGSIIPEMNQAKVFIEDGGINLLDIAPAESRRQVMSVRMLKVSREPEPK